jgi:IS605 OrfB family transposase
MIIRQLKLKLNKTQEKQLEEWLWILTGVYNWALRKIELNAKDKIYYSPYAFKNLLSGHSKRVGISSHVLQSTIMQAYTAWQRCFKKISKKPRLKGYRNKLNSISFSDIIKSPKDKKINMPGLGKLRFYKQDLPEGKIKCGRIIKRASGWYLCLWIDTIHSFDVKETNMAIGIDPGFSTLLTLSDGTKIENPRELRKGELRLAQAQRGNKKQLVAHLQERQANRRKDRNHKISRWLVENYGTIYYSNDNFKKMAKKFGKSVSEASLNQLIRMITYKCHIGGRNIIPINSKYTTMTCSACGAKSGPHGRNRLAVRQWNCACGAQHDRDINAACNVLYAGAGIALEIPKSIKENLS